MKCMDINEIHKGWFFKYFVAIYINLKKYIRRKMIRSLCCENYTLK